jgi:hypothetical protein
MCFICKAGGDVHFHIFFTLVLDGVECLVSFSGRFSHFRAVTEIRYDLRTLSLNYY